MTTAPRLPGILRMRRRLRDLPAATAPPPGIEIRDLRAEDAGAVHALLARAYRDGAGELAPFAEWREAFFADAEFDPGACFVARRADGTVVGVALCWSSAFVKDLAVSEDARRTGVGRALLDAALARFAERGHACVELKLRPRAAPAALALYRAAGFEEVDGSR